MIDLLFTHVCYVCVPALHILGIILKGSIINYVEGGGGYKMGGGGIQVSKFRSKQLCIEAWEYWISKRG